MATTDHRIPVPGLRRAGRDPGPQPNLHLLAGWWTASCPTYGFILAEGRTQQRVERKAARRSCPICCEVA